MENLNPFYNDSAESLLFPRHKTSADIAAGEKVCPVCSREVKHEFVPMVALTEDLAQA